MKSILSFFSPQINLVDYLRTAIDQAKENSKNGEFNLNLSFKDRFGNEDGARYVTQTLSKCENISTLNLELNSSRMKDQDITELMAGIKKLKYLKKLILKFCLNSLTSSSLTQIGEGVGHLTDLEYIELNVEGLKVDNKQTLKQLVEGLQKCQKLSTVIIDMNYCNLEDSGLLILCQSLAKCLNLRELNLGLGCNGFQQDPDQMMSQILGDGPYQVILQELETELKQHNLITFNAKYW